MPIIERLQESYSTWWANGCIVCTSVNNKELLNCVNPTDPTLVDLIPQLPIIPQLDHPPAFYEVEAAIKGLKNNKSAGPDGIPADVFKHQFIHRAWTTGKLPQQWKDATIVTVYKKKGDRQVCGNSRGISLLSVAEKILARVMLKRLLRKVVESSYPSLNVVFAVDAVPLIWSLLPGCSKKNAANKVVTCTSLSLFTNFSHNPARIS